MKLPTLQISMECPYCLETAKLGILSINKIVRCPHCSGEFPATPDSNQRDLIRLVAGCSTTGQAFMLVFERQQPPQKARPCGHIPKPGQAGYTLYFHPPYRLVATITPKEGGSGEAIKTREIKFEEFDFSGVGCPCCGCTTFDYCSDRHFICEGAAKRLPNGCGVENYCPHCMMVRIYDVPIVKVDIYGAPPKQSRVVPPTNRAVRPTSVAKLALPAPSWLTKAWRQK